MSQSEKMQSDHSRPYDDEDDETSSDFEEPADAVEREGQQEDSEEEHFLDENNGNNQQQQQAGQDQQLEEEGGDNQRQQYHDNNNSGMEEQQQGGNFSSPTPGNNPEDRTSATNLIINYLPQDMTDRELYNLFSSCGSINTCKIMRDFKTGYSFGYGFVDYNAEADSEDAIQKLNGFYVRNKRLKVSYARPGGQSIKDTNLYVINLSRNINDEMLDRIFSPFGQIVQRNILRDKLTGRPRGVAFVRYNKREEAQEAIKSLNNTIPEGGSQPIWVRLAEEHGKAKAAQFMSQIGGGGGPQQQPHHHHQQQHHHNTHMQQHHHHQQQQQQHHHHHHHQQQQQHHHHHHHHHQQQQQQQHHHHHNHSMPHPAAAVHHMQPMHHGVGVNVNVGVGVGMGMGVGVGVPPPMQGGGVIGVGGGGGGYHHMAHRGRSNRQTRSQKPHPYNNAQKFI
ncbi:uncharacterized protein Dwil_GK16696, isoform B [Drosophila willistoni]|uniref:Protein sex-lethal n=1 Tax=Drosophila willistoni TaxID=7260 RepID=B4NPW2_DROWI|nr:sex-lethal homolog isoform X1 [Drosophila willistoni]EDW86187.2 uncharacterized protein Dwil_GK16696, isoform B [Drosophila willistoni]